MSSRILEDEQVIILQNQLKALGNRYAVEILQVLSPKTGDIIPSLGWDGIVDGVLELKGIHKPEPRPAGEKTQQEVSYQEIRQRFVSGGTLYETMNKLAKVGFVNAIGARGRKNRRFTITHEGRLALSAIAGMRGPTAIDTEIQRAAKVLLKHKNFTRLLPAQEKFLEEVGDVDGNLVIQMPPGSGKTFLAMIAILIRLQRGVRCLYLTPYTSLNTQVIDEYRELFENLGYSVVRHDGTHRATDADLQNAGLIVSVLESSLSAVLEGKSWTDEIGLAIIDELTELDSAMIRKEPQTLGTDRSTKLDCLITQLLGKAQLITLSSRFGKTSEIAHWLDANVFRPSVRLTPDEFIVCEGEGGFVIESSDGTQRSISSEDAPLAAILEHMENYQDSSVLIVVGTRDAAEGIAEYMARAHPRPITEYTLTTILGPEMLLPVTSRLRESLVHGVAFHHAGLDVDVRERLERSIKNGTIKTVVSTTGITSGISFPFDCVIIAFGTGMYFLVSRSRYLQIAGRIGEYYLSKHGGRVYLVYDGPTMQFRDVETLKETLLHRPIDPIRPGELHPALVASLMMKEAVKGRSFTKDAFLAKFLNFVEATFRSRVDDGYAEKMTEMFLQLFDWLVGKGVLEAKGGKFKISKEAKAAVSSGLNILEFISVRGALADMQPDTDQSEFIEILLGFSLPQGIRPRAIIPTEIELKLAELDSPDERYSRFKQRRDEFKKSVLRGWLDEMSVEDAIARTEAAAREALEGKQPIGSDIGEGDLEALVRISSNISWSISEFLRSTKRRKLARRFELLSYQLKHGVRPDIAGTDLFGLQIMMDKDPGRFLSREEIRTLFNHGYVSISGVVRKDIDAKKAGFARDRFAKNCGLNTDLAKIVYKSALEHIKSQLDDD
ncbi:MAG: DEAD/DEAH box helicase [Candidatus Thorarchaeota archaeon]|jgi:helicase